MDKVSMSLSLLCGKEYCQYIIGVWDGVNMIYIKFAVARRWEHRSKGTWLVINVDEIIVWEKATVAWNICLDFADVRG